MLGRAFYGSGMEEKSGDKKKGRGAHLPPASLSACPLITSRCDQVFRPSRHTWALPTRTGSSLPSARPREKPCAIKIIGIGIVIIIDIVIATRIHHETPLLVSPYIHGMVLYFSSVCRPGGVRLPSSSITRLPW